MLTGQAANAAAGNMTMRATSIAGRNPTHDAAETLGWIGAVGIDSPATTIPTRYREGIASDFRGGGVVLAQNRAREQAGKQGRDPNVHC